MTTELRHLVARATRDPTFQLTPLTPQEASAVKKRYPLPKQDRLDKDWTPVPNSLGPDWLRVGLRWRYRIYAKTSRKEITLSATQLLKQAPSPTSDPRIPFIILNRVTNEADAFSQTISNDRNNALANAARHAYWSARLTQEFGSKWAERFTTAHESKPRPPAQDAWIRLDSTIDLNNNAQGHHIALQHPNATPDQLKALIEAALREPNRFIAVSRKDLTLYWVQLKGPNTSPRATR